MCATSDDCDAFVRSYVQTALWSTNDESDEQGGVPLDRNYSIADIHPRALWAMIRDCDAFRAQNEADIIAAVGDPFPMYARVGRDFWLTRNRHGAGFWDGNYPEPYAARLTEAAHRFGEVDLFCSPRRRFPIDDGSAPVVMTGTIAGLCWCEPCIEHEDCRRNLMLGYACLVRRHQKGGR